MMGAHAIEARTLLTIAVETANMVVNEHIAIHFHDSLSLRLTLDLQTSESIGHF